MLVTPNPNPTLTLTLTLTLILTLTLRFWENAKREFTGKVFAFIATGYLPVFMSQQLKTPLTYLLASQNPRFIRANAMELGIASFSPS